MATVRELRNQTMYHLNQKFQNEPYSLTVVGELSCKVNDANKAQIRPFKALFDLSQRPLRSSRLLKFPLSEKKDGLTSWCRSAAFLQDFGELLCSCGLFCPIFRTVQEKAFGQKSRSSQKAEVVIVLTSQLQHPCSTN